jgi:hypothetical protein
MEPVSFPIQQASSIVDMAKNVVAITPRKNLPKTENAVAVVADKLKAGISEEPMTQYMKSFQQAYASEMNRLMGEGENLMVKFNEAETPMTPISRQQEEAQVREMVTPGSYPRINSNVPKYLQSTLRSAITSQNIPPSSGAGGIFTVSRGGMRGGISSIPDYPSPPPPL